MASFDRFLPQNTFWDDMNRKTEPPLHSTNHPKPFAPSPGDDGSENVRRPIAGREAARGDQPMSADIATSVPGLYRVLNLIHERGTGGLVDKIIIEQDSLGRLINALRPNTYTSITKVDFGALDQVQVKPIGLYGSKSAIVDFLSKKAIVDNAIAATMLLPTDISRDSVRPHLRSGLYILKPRTDGSMFAIYWPEDTTWDDNCSQSVRRNRVTFMRYLTKISDQVVCLISAEHAETLVWRQDETDSDQESLEDDDTDRMFTFEVSKSNEQDENVTIRAGFEIDIPAVDSVPDGADVDLLPPQLVKGDVQQGVVTAVYVPARKLRPSTTTIYQESLLKQTLQEKVFTLSDTISSDALDLLFRLGMRHRAPDAVNQYREGVTHVEAWAKEDTIGALNDMRARISAEEPSLISSLAQYLKDDLFVRFPLLARDGSQTIFLDGDASEPPSKGRVDELCAVYPELKDLLRSNSMMSKLSTVTTPKFAQLKSHILELDYLLRGNPGLSDEQRRRLVLSTAPKDVLADLNKTSQAKTDSGFISGARKLFGLSASSSSSTVSPFHLHVPGDKLKIDDGSFLSQIEAIADRAPLLTKDITEVVALAGKHFLTLVTQEAKDLSRKFMEVERRSCERQIRRKVEIEKERRVKLLRADLLKTLATSMGSSSERSNMIIESVEIERPGLQDSRYSYNRASTYRVEITEEAYTNPEVLYTIQPLELTQPDIHHLQVDVNHIPIPVVHQQSSSMFRLPADTLIIHLRLLPHGRCLLVIRSRGGDCNVYVSPLNALCDAIKHRPSRKLNRDKVGDDFLLAYDESKRILAICSMSSRDFPLLLYTYEIDETYASLQAMGPAVNLSPWYDVAVTIKHMVFVSGREEILLVDDVARARIFSLVTQQFRPATLRLTSVPYALHSTPDGSCFFTVDRPFDNTDTTTLHAYYWSSFGSSEGIKIDIPVSILTSHVVTSLLSPADVYMLGIDHDRHVLQSIAFTISRKVTAFTFQEKGGSGSRSRKTQSESTLHNSLIDCHVDVWTRFPVVPAVRRETIVSAALRQPRCLTFVCNIDRPPFADHFATLIEDFGRATQKPVDDELSNFRIRATNLASFVSKLPFTPSAFRAGEWLVELLCLIPIQIAVTRDNRFVPLKDGVWSAEHERSLLGADVAKIVDSISMGWYESVFQSYMATKPVKVVSSMGEQSVGKSFALNHLVDTSFAGSAMRTTEGVWMSVTPTEEALIVALDFEGVHSIERSIQEDTLLVLFNTAISNLVLFRNNYVLSRDITGLFQSFQSSSSVLDPEANPMLFRSLLMIIIKDVPDCDTDEIKKEFQLKFQQIVQAEQGMNFITRLHHNQLTIVPWPVIESKQFYKLFKNVKKRLDQQPVTHTGGAIFLQTMKTLMAKLKANDWGAMSHNLATHRVHLLLSLLPRALAFGASEITPDVEPLTDLDSAAVIDSGEDILRWQFHLIEAGPPGQPASHEDALRTLCSVWDHFDLRSSQPEKEWLHKLQQYLNHAVDLRIEHVRAWLIANTSKFPPIHADVQQLFRTFDNVIIDLKSSLRLCGGQCADCNLGCIQGYHHEGPHDCRTSHFCVHSCQFEHHNESKSCGLRAGHPGSHLCAVTAHLCGQTCTLLGKRGCQAACVKVFDHEDSEVHMCSATIHECGQACGLVNVVLLNGHIFSCDGLCRISSDIPHDEHRCDNTQCPIECQLCRRLCSMHDHFHAFTIGATHLCGQEHPCSALCQASGICQIETTPHSVEATFTGRHESFQYTKYNQDAKRLRCIKTILVGELEHEGEHSHDLGANPFHYCQTRCPDCGYFCTHPLGDLKLIPGIICTSLKRLSVSNTGHTQQDHETSHGSMSKTKWVVDGPDGTVLQVNGRKFGASDDGAPMLCSMYCQSMGRHAHIDWCRSNDAESCGGPEHEHISTPMQPSPDKPKDWITHSLYWERMGFKDPYSQEDQANFAKCDRMCSGACTHDTGPEHNTPARGPAQPSYCTLPILHPRQPLDRPLEGGVGHVSNDGHIFSCRNPAMLRQAFHVIFVIDASFSMSSEDHRPLDGTPTSRLIRRSHNNRLGAVFSSLQGFWQSRHPTDTAIGGNAGGGVRRDAYTIILFNRTATTAVAHDFASAPSELLNLLLSHRTARGTNFEAGIQAAQNAMETHWSTERSPVIIFLSDGECRIADETVQDLCRRSIALGKPLSFHAVAFGPYTGSLRRMAQIAQAVETGAPRDQLNPNARVPSSFTEALDTVQLAETFLGIADSLGKPRGALFRG